LQSTPANLCAEPLRLTLRLSRVHDAAADHASTQVRTTRRHASSPLAAFF
jgi:hypothetical protein